MEPSVRQGDRVLVHGLGGGRGWLNGQFGTAHARLPDNAWQVHMEEEEVSMYESGWAAREAVPAENLLVRPLKHEVVSLFCASMRTLPDALVQKLSTAIRGLLPEEETSMNLRIVFEGACHLVQLPDRRPLPLTGRPVWVKKGMNDLYNTDTVQVRCMYNPWLYEELAKELDSMVPKMHEAWKHKMREEFAAATARYFSGQQQDVYLELIFAHVRWPEVKIGAPWSTSWMLPEAVGEYSFPDLEVFTGVPHVLPAGLPPGAIEYPQAVLPSQDTLRVLAVTSIYMAAADSE